MDHLAMIRRSLLKFWYRIKCSALRFAKRLLLTVAKIIAKIAKYGCDHYPQLFWEVVVAVIAAIIIWLLSKGRPG